MSALFNFNSFLTVVLLVICTCTFLKMQFPALLEQKTGSDDQRSFPCKIDYCDPVGYVDCDFPLKRPQATTGFYSHQKTNASWWETSGFSLKAN